MIKEAIGTGATLDEAKEAALKALEAPEDADIKYEVLERPQKKVLGLFGGSPAKVKACYEYEEVKADDFTAAKAYLNNILVNLGVNDAEIEIEADSEDVRINISCGDDYGSVIGRRGETLDAIQYLTRLVINRGSDEYRRVSINVGNYREKRENTSHSVGSDGDRKVVITLEEGVKPTGGSGYGNRGRGGYNRGRGGYNNDRSSASSESSVPDRAPRSDSAGASLYGKIEINK